MQLGIYQHYSGKKYIVIGVCRHSETLEEMVVYRRLYKDYGLWVRPKAMFLENVTHDNQVIPRFTFLQELNIAAPSFEL